MQMTQPRYHTKRDPARRTLGPKIGRVMSMLSGPPMPWQQDAANIIGEVDDSGRLHYSTVVITVPRQAGKTALTMATCFHRTLITPTGKIWYTAQNGMVARERSVEMMDVIDRSALGAICKTKRGAGDTRLIIPTTGAQFRPHPPTADSLHGEQGDLNTIDEGWSYTEPQGNALMQAIIPVQNTRPNSQTIILSTEGDADSAWLHGIIDAARAGDDPHTAIIDYGIGPEVDPGDLDAVAAAHPAIGYTIEPDVLARAYGALGPAGFARAYGNRRTATRTALFSPEQIKAVLTTEAMPTDAPVAFGVATAYDRAETAIVAAAIVDGLPVVEVIEPGGLRRGASWAGVAAAELAERHNAPVAIDRHGPASTVARDYEEHTTRPLISPTVREVATSAADLIDRITDMPPRVKFYAHAAWETALDVVTTERLGDGIKLSRKHSSGSIAVLEAASLAINALREPTGPDPIAPMIRW